VNLIVAIPLQYRLAALFVLGVCIGSLLNLGIYRLAWRPRPISPWSRGDPEASPRRLFDRLPVVGWLGLRREASLHGTGFWIRPMLLELLCGIGFAALYWWEVHRQGLLPPDAPRFDALSIQAILHAHYTVHVLLIALMLVASMIDIDEWTIPDAITVPGTLLGLLLAAVYPWSLLPEYVPPSAAPLGLPPQGLAAADAQYWRLLTADTWQVLHPGSPEFAGFGPMGPEPHPAPQGIRDLPQGWLLPVGLACWWLWCVAIMPRSWYSRHGVRRALQLCLARLVRRSATYRILVMGAIGSGIVGWVWFRGGPHGVALLSGLAGMGGCAEDWYG
jgi:prepilin signal peptidase PulO-like enzyme (type II secretory pathway)